jgi:hypothetical protein
MLWSGDSGDWLVAPVAVPPRLLLVVAEENADCLHPPAPKSRRQRAHVGPGFVPAEKVALAKRVVANVVVAELPRLVAVAFRN